MNFFCRFLQQTGSSEMAMPDELNEILNDGFGESAEVIDDNADEQDVVLNVEEAGKAWLWGR